MVVMAGFGVEVERQGRMITLTTEMETVTRRRRGESETPTAEYGVEVAVRGGY